MTLLFLPGARGSASFWQPVAERLADLGPAQLLGYPGFAEVPADAQVRSPDELHASVLRRLPEGPCDVIAQSMGGVLAVRLALEHPARVRRLVLVATSGGVDVTRLGGVDWRPEYRATMRESPAWFADDRTDFSERLSELRAPTLLLWGDADPISPPAVGTWLATQLAGARLVVFPGGTHTFANERPDEVASAIRAHLT